MERVRGEMPSSMQFSTMTAIELTIFGPSGAPEAELTKLHAELATRPRDAHMRIAGIHSNLGRDHLPQSRRHFAHALAEAELEFLTAREASTPPSGREDVYELAQMCGTLCFCLGEIAEILECPDEARDHFARGARYMHDHSSLKLSLYEKQKGNFDYALHLITSTEDPEDLDAQYLLGDHFYGRGDIPRAREYYEIAASLGHRRAMVMDKRLRGREITSEDSGMEKEYQLNDNWTATVDNLFGGVVYYYDDSEVEDLTAWNWLHWREDDPRSQRSELAYFLDQHDLAKGDLLERTVVFKDSSREGFIQARAHSTSYSGIATFVTDLTSGETEEYAFESIATALKELRVLPESICQIRRREK